MNKWIEVGNEILFVKVAVSRKERWRAATQESPALTLTVLYGFLPLICLNGKGRLQVV